MITEEQAKQYIREILFEDGMSEDDFSEIEKIYLTCSNKTYKDIAKNFQTGVDNGWPIKYQIKIAKLFVC